MLGLGLNKAPPGALHYPQVFASASDGHGERVGIGVGGFLCRWDAGAEMGRVTHVRGVWDRSRKARDFIRGMRWTERREDGERGTLMSYWAAIIWTGRKATGVMCMQSKYLPEL